MDCNNPTRFIIVCAARTGSTMLRLMLNSHPDMRCHGEVFTLSENKMYGFVGIEKKDVPPIYSMLLNIRNIEPVRFLKDFVFFAGNYSAIGVKILYMALESERMKGLLSHILYDTHIKVVHVTRENRLKRYLSAYITDKVTRVYRVLSEDEKPHIPKIRIPLDECLTDMEKTEADEKRIRGLFPSHNVFEISYEDIASKTGDKVYELQRFLGVHPQTLSTPTVKLSSGNIADMVENYIELERRLQGTRYERFLHS